MAEFTRLGDRYDIGSVIGRGGMAEVFEATDSRLNRRVAINMESKTPDNAVEVPLQ